MCGRYASVASTADLTLEFEVDEALDDDLPPSWNVAPTDPVRVVVERHPGSDREASPVRQLRTVRWGLVPGWSQTRNGGAKMINARGETLASKPAFRAAAARRRCLVPSLGHYEWKREGGRKIPYFLHAPDEPLLAMAGLYEIWRDGSLPEDHLDGWLWTCTIITRPATDLLGEIHDRCPVLVPPDLREHWLDCSADDPLVAQRLLENMPEPHLEPRLVSTAVGNVKNNGPELIEPVPDELADVLPLPFEDATARGKTHEHGCCGAPFRHGLQIVRLPATTSGCPARTPTGSRSSSPISSTRPPGCCRSPGCTSCGRTRPRTMTPRTGGCGRRRSSPTTRPGWPAS
jgi:putative SOS response-associated peptidase YedK